MGQSVPSFSWCALIRTCIVEVQAKEKVARDVCEELLLSILCEEVRGVAMEALSEAKQQRKARLEALKREFQLWQLSKYWERCVSHNTVEPTVTAIRA